MVEQAEIRGGVMLMFENIKNNGITIDISQAEVQCILLQAPSFRTHPSRRLTKCAPGL